MTDVNDDIARPAEVSAMSRGVSAKRRAAMADLAAKLAALPELSAADLRAEWRRIYRSQPPRRIGRHLLELGIAWKLQERAYGGLSTTMKRRLAELAKTVDEKGDLAKTRAIRLKPGTRLIREWQGETHDVLVLEDGFQWRGLRWRSLSAIAGEISGTHWSGPRFFGLQGNAGAAEEIGFGTGAREARNA